MIFRYVNQQRRVQANVDKESFLHMIYCAAVVALYLHFRQLKTYIFRCLSEGVGYWKWNPSKVVDCLIEALRSCLVMVREDGKLLDQHFLAEIQKRMVLVEKAPPLTIGLQCLCARDRGWWKYLTMDGRAIFWFCYSRCCLPIKNTIESYLVREVDERTFLAHQANDRIWIK